MISGRPGEYFDEQNGFWFFSKPSVSGYAGFDHDATECIRIFAGITQLSGLCHTHQWRTVHGSVNITCSIYDTQTGAMPLWTDALTVDVNVTQGIFGVEPGGPTSNPSVGHVRKSVPERFERGF
jgi:hypothetical protein